jgi:isopentenyl-diphosphate delta-isomerase
VPDEPSSAAPVRAPGAELVVLLDEGHRPVGTADKATVHQASTPLHLAFSCYLFDDADRLLVTRRALGKRTWPGVWTNSCCGHPGPGEPPEEAVRRRVREELGGEVTGLRLVLPEFAYRASMDGVEENELCPVYLGRLAGDVRPDDTEVAEVDRVPWAAYVAWARGSAGDRADLSVWSRLQVEALEAEGAVAAFLAGTS